LFPTIQPKKVKYASFVVGNSAISRNYIGYVVRNLNILIKKDLSYVSGNTTTLSSFTDGLIPSVTAMKSVGENHTDGLTDGTRPSV
jgi:hypothetical protein